ncbi:MAG TPA: nuclear transport factor 2 family protein [Candidatus Acidoferrum sp.]|jgi:ketosteroid isomerase-like protein|nr:nuclear transport factor 2 family protein [Candidatus Acidoferrum sp.]
MKKKFASKRSSGRLRKAVMFLLGGVFLVANVASAGAQKDKKKKKDETQPTDSSKTVMAMTDEQQIDYLLSEMLGAWQIGDVEKLHATYADDVSVVSAGWTPPVIGWANFSPLFQQTRARMQRVRMDRSNTFIRVNGNTGWACYQWDFSADVDGQAVQSRGQTTVVVVKRNNHWLIVHNHTSLSPGGAQTSPANTTTPQQPAAKPN